MTVTDFTAIRAGMGMESRAVTGSSNRAGIINKMSVNRELNSGDIKNPLKKEFRTGIVVIAVKIEIDNMFSSKIFNRFIFFALTDLKLRPAVFAGSIEIVVFKMRENSRNKIIMIRGSRDMVRVKTA